MGLKSCDHSLLKTSFLSIGKTASCLFPFELGLFVDGKVGWGFFPHSDDAKTL